MKAEEFMDRLDDYVKATADLQQCGADDWTWASYLGTKEKLEEALKEVLGD